MAGPTIAFVASGAARALLAYLERCGHPQHAVLAATDVDAAHLAPDGQLPRPANQRLWAHATLVTGDEALGLHVAAFAGRGTFGLLEYLARTARSVADCLELLVAYSHLPHGAVRFELLDGDAAIALVHRTVDGRPQPAAVVDFVAASLAAIAHQIAGLSFGLCRVELARPQPEQPRPWQRLFRCPITFDAPVNRWHLDKRTIQAPLPGHDPALHHLLQVQADTRVGSQPPPGEQLAEQVAVAIEEALLLDGAELDGIARRLATSPRTLRRRLGAEGLSFRALRDDVRRRLALQLAGTAPQAEVAAELGFDSPSAYRRAFTRWTGMSPSAWLAQQQAG